MPRVVSILLLGLLAAPASAAPPTVESVLPAGGQRGTEFILTLTGARLTDPAELMLYNPGVTCTKLTAASENEITATLKAAADCRLGEYQFRIRTKGGASELQTFRVTPLSVAPEKEPNNSRRGPQSIPLNVTVTGVVESGDLDCFAVTLKKGQRLSAEVVAVRLGGALLDTVLTVYGPDGRELVTVDDAPLFRQDPFASLVAPADGTYVVQVREANYGGDTARYMLHVGTFPRPAAVFPPGGPAGAEVALRFAGGAGDFERKLKLPADREFVLYPDDGTTAAPSPMPFRVSPFPNVIEAEPNDEPGHATTAPQWPVAFNGVIGRQGDVDHFAVRLAKGDMVRVEAFAYRVGSPLDTTVAVTDPSGGPVAFNDDDETHDSKLCFTAPADGQYRIEVADKRKQGGSGYLYRVEVDRPRPALSLFLPGPARKSQERQVIAVPRGNRVTAFLGAHRVGFDGAVTVRPGELPRGVSLKAGPIPAGRYLVPVVFEATADAPLGGRLVELTGTGGDPKAPVTGGFVQTIDLSDGPGDSAYHSTSVSKLAVVVVEPVPFTLSVVPPATPLVRDGALDLTVRVTRAAGFAGPVDVSLPFLPPWVEGPQQATIPADKTEVMIPLKAQPRAEPGDWQLTVEGTPSRPGRKLDPTGTPLAGFGGGFPRRPRAAADGAIPVASELVPLRLSDPAVAGTIAATVAEQGKTVRLVCKLAPNEPLAGKFRATLEGLPPRVAVKPVEVSGDATGVAFELAVEPTAPLGEHRSLVCQLAGKRNGQKVSFFVGRGGVLKIEPAGGVVTDASGKPLSPLDALRKAEGKK